MYGKGKGIKQDDFKALKFFQKACDLNNGTIRATTAIIQTTRLLGKLECLEIILFNAFAFFIHKSKIKHLLACCSIFLFQWFLHVIIQHVQFSH
jgi:hypothetical protein